MKNWSRFCSMASVLCILMLVFSAVAMPDALAAAADAAGSGGGYLAGYENTDPKPSQMSWWSTLAYLISLLAVFAFVVVMAYFASRFLSGRFQHQTAANGGRILEHLALGPNKSVCVVEIGGKVVLLGVTEHQVNLLAEIEDADEIDRLRRQAVAQPVDMGAFASQLSSLEELTRRVPSLFREGLNRRG